jgi:hypothetical protein
VRASHTSPSVSTAVDIDHPALKNPGLRPAVSDTVAGIVSQHVPGAVTAR